MRLIDLLSALFVLVLVVALFATPAPALAQCNQAGVLNSVDASLNAKLNKVRQYETDYLLAHGRYYQALWTHAATPNGSQTAVDQLTSRPHYQTETLQDLFDKQNIQRNLPNRFRIDQYDGPQGQGFVIVAEVVACGLTMQRHYNTGAETYRELGWHEVVTAP